MEISQYRIQEVLKLYVPEARALISAQIDYPILRGEFKLPPTFYTTSPLRHAADIEVQLCLNQLAYIGVAEAIRGKQFPELEGLDFEDLQKEGCLIIESRKKFRKPIKTDLVIRGEIKIENFRDHQKLILGYATFNFENRSCIGDLTLALVRNTCSNEQS